MGLHVCILNKGMSEFLKISVGSDLLVPRTKREMHWCAVYSSAGERGQHYFSRNSATIIVWDDLEHTLLSSLKTPPLNASPALLALFAG